MGKTYPLGLSMDERHVYRYNNGTKTYPLPGVTTIIHTAWNKSDALVGWAKRVVADNAVDQYDALGRVIDSLGPQGAKRWLKAQPDQERDASADLGTRVHTLAEMIAKDMAYQPADDEAPFVTAYLDWYRNNPLDINIVATETKVWSIDRPFNPLVAYAGTADVWLDVNDELVIADYKTGKHIYPHEVLMQLGAYATAESWDRPEPKQNPSRALVLHIRPEGATEHWYTNNELCDGAYAFRTACDIWLWSKRKLG